MRSEEIRSSFLNFFKNKGHHIVPSAPLVAKDDPTLLFINAGMNQFKDLFLGNTTPETKRITDSQKCLRVSGKHNDLEEVGVDTYHHTLFEMLGNWSFGDYFKEDAIKWAWELLTEVYKIPIENIYVTYFEGNTKEGLAADTDSLSIWKDILPENRILKGSKKDNFWEMGSSGPCGPSSEIHVDLRSEEEKKQIPGNELVNRDHPQVVEIWNLVFMEYNRLATGKLVPLPEKHVDTGMGFERLAMVLQEKQATYDTDIFRGLIEKVEVLSRNTYGSNGKKDIATRVIVDHIRAISFSIADGQLPSNTGAGYVIRRILRRAVRYGFQALDLKEPFLYQLVEVLSKQMGTAYPELPNQIDLIKKVILEEERAFLKTLDSGLKRLDIIFRELEKEKLQEMDGATAFELYDTYGFPIDLTTLIASEKKFSVSLDGFNAELQKQKDRSRKAEASETSDWVIVNEGEQTKFIGYEDFSCEASVLKYRRLKDKKKEYFQLVLNKTPFYPEGGGQVGDSGLIKLDGGDVKVFNTKKENNLILHLAESLPPLNEDLLIQVNKSRRQLTARNHSATHLLHAALRQVLGNHVEQKGSLVNDEYLRFDFSHFSKVKDEELQDIEQIVNLKIQESVKSNIEELPLEEAKAQGAMALFGEKYGNTVRVVSFDKSFSIELCGGTHVDNSAELGRFKIVKESAVASGVRRIEAITSLKADEYLNEQLNTLEAIATILKKPKDLVGSTQSLVKENNELKKEVEALQKKQSTYLKEELKSKVVEKEGVNFLIEKVDITSSEMIKNIAFELRKEIVNLYLVFGAIVNDKPNLTVAFSDNLVKEKSLNAVALVKEIAKEIKGGGGGQPFYATAGGKDASGIDNALKKAREITPISL